MPPKNSATGSESKQEETFSTMTTAEQRFLRAIFQHMAHAPDTNWDQVASDTNLKSAKVAKDRFRQISKRHNWVSGGGFGGGKSGGKGRGGNRRPSTAVSPRPYKVTKPNKEGKPSAAKKKTAQPKFESDTDEPEEIKLDSDDEKHGGVKSEDEEPFEDFDDDEI